MLNQVQPDANIPAEIHQLADNHHVGIPLKFYQIKSSYKTSMIFSTVLMLILIVSDISLTFLNQPLNWKLLLAHSIMSISLLLILLWEMYREIREIRSRLYLCSQGLLLTIGKEQETIRWDEIQIAYYSTVGSVLTRLNGKKFRISRHVSQLGELNTIIEDQTKEKRISSALAQYEQGQTVQFGNLKVNQDGIVDLDNAITWEQLEDIRLEQYVLSLKYEGEWHDWYGKFTPKIYVPNYTYPPNLPIFLALVQHILAEKNGALQGHRD